MKVPQKVDIPDYPYYITIDGEVFRKGSDKPLKYSYRKFEGSCVCLCNNGKRKSFRISNLMRMCYFNNTKKFLKHLDGVESNYSYWNLKPVTEEEHIKSITRSNHNRKAVIEILPDGTENIYSSATECAKANFVHKSTISYWCNGKCKNKINDNQYRWED